MKKVSRLCSVLLIQWMLNSTPVFAADTTSYVDLVTNKGTITVGLYEAAAPVTTKNFLQYINAGLYTGTIIHRLVPNFVFQGGWLNAFGQPITTFPPIQNEARTSKLSNIQGTIAMARSTDANSATSQFFFNLADNSSVLDFGTQNAPDGYAVFGNVVAGLPVVMNIAAQTPFNAQALPFPVTAAGQMTTIQGAFPYSLGEGTTPVLRVLVTGTGAGLVRTQPGGTCRMAPCTYKIKGGQRVSLTATATVGSYFSGWSGDCLGGDRTTSLIAPKSLPSSTNCVASFTKR